jgi:hypothetical protein
MVDREARLKLRDALSKLVGGEMTNDEFDELYYEHWIDSPDRAVKEIAGFGYGLYSSDVLIPYWLKGRHEVRGEEREAAKRCLKFLGTELEYPWPPFPNQSAEGCVWAIAFNLLLPGSIALIFVGFLANGWIGFWDLGVWGFLSLGLCWLLFRVAGMRDTPEWRSFWACGDRNAWPFLATADVCGGHAIDLSAG